MNQNQKEKRRKDKSFSMLMQMRTVLNSPKLVLVTFLVTRKRIERKNISFSQRIRPDGSRLFRTRRNSIERTWTTLRMCRVGSSRPWLFHIFQLRALIFSLPVGELFSKFWRQLISIGCVYIPFFKKIMWVEKNLKSSSRTVGFFFHLPYRICLNLHILTIIHYNM